ncbi:peptidase S10 [Sandarakinorhabdus sp.]|uniref:S10 family peptidase n=1 Tax=Sandarakinorhabdus sp. TaxID=1916663 RepID=UPI00333F3F31
MKTLMLAGTALAAACFVPNAAAAQEKRQTPREAMVAEADAAAARPPVTEQAFVSKGSVTVKGKAIAYTATAGTLTIRDDAARPTGSLSYQAYTAEGAGRPVTFFYNGGPGSPTVWLHMGSFGPVRVKTDKPAYVSPDQYAVTSNPWSLIDKTDIVFIDAMGAGWSRPLGDKLAKDFNGVDQDADAFARAIARYVARNNRWTAPKFLFGESYGTLRSGAVAAILESRGMSLNGIALLSTIMNYGVRQPGYDQNHLTLFPGYAATAWYHGTLPGPKPASLDAFVAEVRAWVSGAYAAALAKGSSITAAEADAIAAQMNAYTGLPIDFIKRANLRVDLPHFQTELLRSRGLSIGRLDTRYTLLPTDGNADSPDDDPAGAGITGAYISAFNDYAIKTLGVKTDLPYRLSAREPGFSWDWSHRPPRGGTQTTPNTAVDLAFTMRANPKLKILFLNGYYDMATPFYGAEYDAAHMLLPADLNKNIRFTYYQSGHMIYLAESELAKMKDDVAAWYDEALK